MQRIGAVAVLVVVLFGAVLLARRPALPKPGPERLAIPAATDWVDFGPIFERGGLGDWDLLLWGGFGGSAVKSAGVYYLYFQGASGYRPYPDEGASRRAIGVATSRDGVNFEKYPGNP